MSVNFQIYELIFYLGFDKGHSSQNFPIPIFKIKATQKSSGMQLCGMATEDVTLGLKWILMLRPFSPVRNCHVSGLSASNIHRHFYVTFKIYERIVPRLVKRRRSLRLLNNEYILPRLLLAYIVYVEILHALAACPHVPEMAWIS